VQRTEPREEGAVGVVAAIERYEFLRGEETVKNFGKGSPRFLVHSRPICCGAAEIRRLKLQRFRGLRQQEFLMISALGAESILERFSWTCGKKYSR